MINWRDHISADPNICHGQACLKGTRIMAWIILEMLAGGATTKEILQAYPQLSERSIQASLAFAAQSLENTRYFYLSKPNRHAVSH